MVVEGKIQKGGARARSRGPSTVDEIAYVAFDFVTPAPSFFGGCKSISRTSL